MTLSNRSLDRGLTLIETLARNDALSLAELHRATDLPKSTLRRLLATLIARRFVRRSLSDGRYRIAVTLPDMAADQVPRHMALIADAALPHALALTRAIGWPSDIHVRDGLAMRIVDSTRGFSPYHLYRGTVNRRVSHFGAASGAVCLSVADPAEVADLHAKTKDDPIWGLGRFSLSFSDYMEILTIVRARGYGARLATYLSDTLIDDELSAIAVPLRLNSAPVGALSILWPRSFKPVEPFAAQHLAALQDAATQTEADLARLAVNQD